MATTFGDREHVPGGTETLILHEHDQNALHAPERDTSRYHHRAPLHRLNLA